MKNALLITLFSLIGLATANAQCCNVVDGSGLAVVDTNNVCVIAPNSGGGDGDCGDSDIADADGDGVADVDDECPHEAGPASNGGCPELTDEELAILKAALEGVNFNFGNDVLTEPSKPKLHNVAELMKKHPDFKLKVSGYTDNKGSHDFNVTLSEKRANSVKAYLISEGIAESRIMAKGYGEENPIADNNTEEGRAKNRRVEFELIH